MLKLYGYKKKLLAARVLLMLFLSMLAATAQIMTPAYAGSKTAKFLGGDGTSDNPYQIADCAQLQSMSLDLAANYVLANDINCATNKVWVPIGTTAPGFTGTFDARNRTISNLDLTNSVQTYTGLFGIATNATIENVDLEVVGFGRGDSIGGLVGYSASGTKILSSSVIVNVSTGNGLGSAGGLVGTNAGSIFKSHAVGRISFAGGSRNDGGLVGFNTGEISNSYAQVALEFTGGVSYAGGLVGLNDGRIVDSYATGHLSLAGGYLDVGGLVGHVGNNTLASSVVDSYYDTNTSGESDHGKGTPETTMEMYQKATYQGFDFSTVWAINENNYYPVMAWDAGKGDLDKLQEKLKDYEKKHKRYYKKYHSFQGKTYNVSQGNKVTVLQTPDVWGQPLNAVGYIPWDGQNSDFSDLPVCTNDPGICAATKTQCVHLSAFYNGITGRDVKRCVGSADKMVDQIYQVMTSAKQSIDITTLADFPNGRFLAAMRNAITWLAVNKRDLAIRVLVGVPLPSRVLTQDEALQTQAHIDDRIFLNELLRDIPQADLKNINFYVGSMRSCGGGLPFPGKGTCVPRNYLFVSLPYRTSWNHSKIIDADGQLSIVGGQNWWTKSYLLNDAINDVNVKVEGPASRDASHFADQLWAFICKGGNDEPETIADSTSWVNGQYGVGKDRCLGSIPLPLPSDGNGDTAVMGIGRLGEGMLKNTLWGGDEPANQSEIAKNLLFDGAVSKIRIAQQDLQSWVLGTQLEISNDAGNVYKILANFVLSHGDLYVVTTNYGAKDAGGESYYAGLKLTDLANTFKDYARRERPDLSEAKLNTLLCKHLHLASIGYSNSNTWPNGNKIGNHSKVWIIDNKTYYVGSHNIYPANLQEYGYIVSGAPQTETFIQQFWDPLWKYSQKNAISGSEVGKACYYGKPNKDVAVRCSSITIVKDTPIKHYKGCDGGKDLLKFTLSGASRMPEADMLVCSKYAQNTPKRLTDTWTNCGKGELGKTNYEVSY